MIRLQRVTFLALHDYLGLTTELTRPDDDIQLQFKQLIVHMVLTLNEHILIQTSISRIIKNFG